MLKSCFFIQEEDLVHPPWDFLNICIQGQRGGDGKKSDEQNLGGTGEKALVESEPRKANQLESRDESSRAVQTSVGTSTFMSFWGHVIFSSARFCIPAPRSSAASSHRGLSLLDHLMILMWCQLQLKNYRFPQSNF